jgi:anti-anti-sigma factor
LRVLRDRITGMVDSDNLSHSRPYCVQSRDGDLSPLEAFPERQVLMPESATTNVLTLTVCRSGDDSEVRCNGRLVAGVNDRLQSEVSRLIPSSKRILLDFTDLTHMDSTGLGTLVRLYVSAKSAGCALQLYNVGKPIRQLLGITHLISVFEVIGNNNIRCG